jgi:uncharacterized protein YecA (UPF0149 family)
MNLQDGSIYYRRAPMAAAMLGDGPLVPVQRDEMTNKQFAQRKVSLKDHKSTLGVKLSSLRNKKCGCGSGLKYKKCCLFKQRGD